MKAVIKNIRNISLIIFVAVFLTTCSKEKRCDCMKSTGDIVTEVRHVDEFNQIQLESKINLFLQQDTFNSIKVEAGENLLYDIYTKVEDSILIIRDDNKCNWVRSYKPKINVYLKFKDIWHFIYFKGAGTVITEDTIRTDFFQLDDNEGTGSLNFLLHTNTSWFNIHTGPADLIVKGVSDLNYLYTCGNGPADLRDFKTNVTYLTSKSTADDYIWVSGEIDAWLDYTGNVYFKGNPSKVTHNYTGSGRLIPF